MNGFKKRFLALFLVFVMVLSSGMVVFATDTDKDDAYVNLLTALKTGQYTCATTSKQYDYSQKKYSKTGGGYAIFPALVNSDAVSQAATGTTGVNPFVESTFSELKAKSKQDFIRDCLAIANAMAYDTENNKGTSDVTSETVNMFVEDIQDMSGMGSTLLATLLQNTKPDYVTANRLYQPFSGVVGTILGIVSILIMALLGVTMALDLAYITIPAVQMALGGDENVNQKGEGKNGKGLSGLVSVEAKKACEAASGGSGGQAGQGEYKAAVGIYFKYRWKGLTILVICLLYLVQGEIYSIIGWFIDLFSGFLG